MALESYWEKIAETNLRQGDFLINCSVPVFSDIPKESLESEIEMGKPI